MVCAQCGAEVSPTTAFCQRCGNALQGAAPFVAATSTVPLTAEQIMTLRVNTFGPVLIFAVVLAGIVSMGACFLINFFYSPFVRGFWAIIGLFELVACVLVVMHVRNNRADLRSGVAQVAVVPLLRKRHRYGNGQPYYADFDGIGTVIILHEVYETLVEGASYRVTYSLHTKKGWSIEPHTP